MKLGSEKTDKKVGGVLANNAYHKSSQTSSKPRRKRLEFEGEQFYVPNKKVRRTKNYYQSSVTLFDSLNKENYQFRVFKEEDLKFPKEFDKKLIEATLDDDCPTDTE